MSLLPSIDDRSARIAARRRLRNPVTTVVDDGINLRREKKIPSYEGRVEERHVAGVVARAGAQLHATHDEAMLYEVMSLIGADCAPPQFMIATLFEGVWRERESKKPKVSIKQIQAAVARRFQNLTIGDMKVYCRAKSRPRQIAMYLARELTGASYTEIGRMFARDHTTILWGVEKIRKLVAEDRALVRFIEDITGELTGTRSVPISLAASPIERKGYQPQIDLVKATVARRYNIPIDIITMRDRNDRYAVRARQVAMAIAVQFGWNNTAVAKAFDGRSHSCAAESARKIAQLREKDMALNSRINDIIAELKSPC